MVVYLLFDIQPNNIFFYERWYSLLLFHQVLHNLLDSYSFQILEFEYRINVRSSIAEFRSSEFIFLASHNYTLNIAVQYLNFTGTEEKYRQYRD